MEIKGGKKFEEALDKMAARLRSGGVLRVGFLENATYPNGTKVAAVAANNEYGTKKAPSRPFFRSMIKQYSKTWPEAIAKNLKATNYDVETTLNRVGMGIKGQLQDTIRDFQGAPLAPSTIARKGFDKQLIDSGHMLNSVDFDIKK